uniref:Interferon-induced GTP-binding protein Mx n=1 Tax=Sphaeramia orbicularis TaxID=375764 RepID=A0A672Z8A8_9TELE
MNTLNQQYEEKVRPCIDLIDSLRSLGVEKDLALPAIAVIGDQSSGKSSVLEALSGVALPRGSGIVTRCPLELKMKRKKKGEEWYGRISYRNHDEKLNNPADVESKIREAQESLAGAGSGISDELISLEIACPNVPDLTLIDLPGITRVAVKDQPENIGDQIKSLIEKFIKRQETISLVVVPCNVDIATTEALKMAQEVDPDGERTLGILTKPDLVDKGTEQTVIEIVRNEVIHLKKGYMIVRCRGQKEITKNVSLSEAIRKEKAFFKEHAFFNVLYDDGHATIPKLAENLTLELVHHIEKCLPQLEEQIKNKLIQTNAELQRYGDGPPTDKSDNGSFLIDVSHVLFCVVIWGYKYLNRASSNSKFDIHNREFENWRSRVENSGRAFNSKLEKEVAQYDIRYRGRELPGFISYKTFERMIKEQITLLEKPAVQKLEDVAGKSHDNFSNSFVGFPNLINAAKFQIEAISQEKKTIAESMLRTQFKMESIVYTQDSRYSKKLGKRKREEDALKGFNHIRAEGDTSATLKEMMKHLKSYYQIAGSRLADQIPLVIRYQMLKETGVQLQREMLQMLQDKTRIELLLKEDCGIKNKRANLQGRCKRLTKAHARLSEFHNARMIVF